MTDPIQELKAKQREGWAYFTPIETATTPGAARLVKFAGVKPGQNVLDVGCGTGVVAITARRTGAKVTGLDLTPELLARAKEHSSVKGYEDIVWKEGDVEVLPFGDNEFDVVVSQFGHMFAPRPDVAVKEMLRVLKPGGILAFNTWPPELIVGQIFALVGKYSPPLPAGASPPSQWGDIGIVRQRLEKGVRDLTFDRDTLYFPALSPGHYRVAFEQTAGPVINLVKSLKGEPEKLAQFRNEFETLVARYYEPERNVTRQDFLLTRCIKA